MMFRLMFTIDFVQREGAGMQVECGIYGWDHGPGVLRHEEFIYLSCSKQSLAKPLSRLQKSRLTN